MTEYISEIPVIFIQLLLTLLLSLILGLEQRKSHPDEQEQLTFGTDRTFTYISLFGFALLIADMSSKRLYLAGGFVLTVLLGIFYFQKIKNQNNYGLTGVLLALLTYVIPLVIVTQPYWLTMLFFVIVLILSESKGTFGNFSQKIDRSEFITLAKFIIITGIILPIVPDQEIFTFLHISPYKVWLAVVVISGISYLSYLLRRFVFPEAGLQLTGILGGLYSSTATTIILARKSKEADEDYRQYAGAIILATAMMFLRIYLLLFIFNQAVGILTTPWFILLFFISFAVAYFMNRQDKESPRKIIATGNIMEDKNPLEFKIAIVFALLYVFFSFVTQYTLQNFGDRGLNILSYVVGFTDIDPFLLNLFQGKYDVTALIIGIATFQAILSNNVLKLAYSVSLGNKGMTKYLLRGFGIIILVNLAVIIFMHISG